MLPRRIAAAFVLVGVCILMLTLHIHLIICMHAILMICMLRASADCMQGPTFIREGLYTGGYLGVTPVLLEFLKGSSALEGYPSSTPLMIAGITGGLLAVTSTQPFDTIKTRMQANVVPKETPEYRNSITTMQHVMKQGGGLKALWSGIAPRALRIVGATFILNGTRTFIVDKVEASRTSK